ncbi:uncharacterized protein LOC112638244 [Camponotus floridanus]|uniref:uncharacterized protein LOC112638244 n=1 Tax=Camponotus floridanus TaxID=104421 RepID=UPI000DC6A250|nr:uncharacterized protein LOC112638244 [Camponotus floridanus]
MTQLLTGHGCLYTYLYRIGKASTPICPFCDEEEDSAEHTIQRCSVWNAERELLTSEIGEDLSLQTIVEKMCESEEGWLAFNNFAEGVMFQKEEDKKKSVSLSTMTTMTMNKLFFFW